MTEVPASSLLRRVCHDLTQPLTALQGSIELALHLNHSVDEMRQSLIEAGEEAERITDLMRSVRSFADALPPFSQPQQASLQIILNDAIAGLPGSDPHDSPAIFAELDQTSETVIADPDRLKTAFQQILDFVLAHATAPLTVSLHARQIIVIGRNSHLTSTDCAAILDPHFSQPAGKHITPSERFRLAAAALTIQRAGGHAAAQPGRADGQILIRITFAPPAD